MGIGRRLLADVIGNTNKRDWVYTHKTNACERFLRGMRHDRVPAVVKA